jgi:hypothetical protein
MSDEFIIHGAAKKKRIADMSRDELVNALEEKQSKLHIAENLYKDTEEEKQKLLLRISKLISEQRQQLDSNENQIILDKVINERDTLKQKALELINRSKAAQLRINELSSDNDRLQSLLKASEDSNKALLNELHVLRNNIGIECFVITFM